MHTISPGHKMLWCGKAVQNKLCGLSQIFLQKVRGREVKKHTHWKTHRFFFFLLKTMWKSAWSDLKVNKILLPSILNRPIMREIQWKMHQSLKQPVVLNFELILILLVKQRNKGNEKLLRICFNKDKSALFICVCFSDRDCKGYEGGDSNRTIYFERP